MTNVKLEPKGTSIKVNTARLTADDKAIISTLEIPVEVASELKPSHQKFLIAYLENKCNRRAACQIAGISESTGRRVLAMPNAKAFLTALQTSFMAQEIASAFEVMATLTSQMRGERNDQTVNNKTGEVVDLKARNQDIIKSAEVLAKAHKLLDHKHEVDTRTTIVVDIEGLEETETGPNYHPIKKTDDDEYITL
ncbi:terminase small subunit [Bacillus thuringiensis]|nr:terminase small subunit [Bacillus thuringiensis]